MRTVSEKMVKKALSTDNSEKKKLKRLKKVKPVKIEPSTSEAAPIESDELKYLRYSISDRYSASRQLFLKVDKSNEYSLIVANVPAYLPEGAVEGFIKQFVPVPISEVVVQRSNALDGSLSHGQLTLSVRFEDPKGVHIALSKCQDVGPYKACDFADPEIPSVLQNSVALYRRLFPSPEDIQKSAAAFIEKQDEEVQEAKRAAKRKFTEPDEEGWITVTKAAKRVGKAMKVKKDEIPLMGGLNKKKNHVDLAFYSFDKKNTKTKKLNELREKFMQDKKRIALLKNARKFNPD
ncbi:ribosomal RNA-processing protein 7-like family protein [Ancylostoma ceylanicum]|uniref:Ribosomal RNA-processing protein 7-like family protein n=2 Tax=Ancylostoma ceylanicum TaxID=53326 RepID=A0A0D6LYS4_9BILA|nr:ribosomal RNA-processing protein 7-like family protein [Ancylostoma ceylanicum]